jgi:hypothetical protein
MWTAVAVMVGDIFQSPVAYAVAAGIFFVLVAAGGILILRRNGQLQFSTEPRAEEDPYITGEKKGIGYYVLQVVGGLIAVPFLLWDYTLKALDNLAKLAPEEKTNETDQTESSGGD